MAEKTWFQLAREIFDILAKAADEQYPQRTYGALRDEERYFTIGPYAGTVKHDSYRERRFTLVLDDRRITVSCGSGVVSFGGTMLTPAEMMKLRLYA